MDFSKLNEVQQKEEYIKIIGAVVSLIGSIICAAIATIATANLEKPKALISIILAFIFCIIYLIGIHFITHKYMYNLISLYGIDKDKQVKLCIEIQDKCHLSCSYHPDVYEFYKELSVNDCDVLERFLKKKK